MPNQSATSAASASRKQALLERLQRLESYLAADPNNSQLLSDTFQTALNAAEFDKAEDILGRGKSLAGDVNAWLFNESNLRIAQRRLEEASAILQSLRQALGQHPAISQNLAYIAFLQERYAECSDLLWPLANAEAGTPIDPEVQVMWLRALHRQGLLEDAIGWYDFKAAGGALSPAAAGVASLICIDADHLEKAKQLSELALRSEPMQMEALVARATVALGERDANGARQLLAKGIEQNPQDGRTWSALGFAEMLAADFDRALLAFRQAVTYMPKHIGTWQGLGWTCLMRNDLPGARDAFEKALAIDHNFGESHGAVAVIQALSGDRAGAQQSIERARRLDKEGLAGRYAEAILSGEAFDPQAMQRLARQLLGNRKGPMGGKMADWLPPKK